MKCAILGDRATEWVANRQPQVKVTTSDFDTITQTFTKAGDLSSPIEWNIGDDHEEFDNMYLTDVDLSQRESGILTAEIKWMGVFDLAKGRYGYLWSNAGRLLKPPVWSARTYTTGIRKEFFADAYDIKTPRLTVTETYITDSKPSNNAIGKKGSPLNSPSVVSLSNSQYPIAFYKRSVSPNGWILNTRNWTQVLDKDLYRVNDEWIYQIPEEFAVVA